MPAPAHGLITVEGPPDVGLTSGMPDQEKKERVVRIYKPAKNAMQSGTAGIKRWKIEFDNQQRVVRIYKPAKNAMQSDTAGIKRW